MSVPLSRGVYGTLRLLAPMWAWIEVVCRRYGVAPELLLAIMCVETEATPTRSHAVFAMSNQALADMTAWCPDRDPDPTTLEEVAYAAAHLAVQCQRFSRLTLALAAFRADPEGVADQGEAVLDRPEVSDYVRRVFDTMAWLADTRPWRPWDALPPLERTA